MINRKKETESMGSRWKKQLTALFILASFCLGPTGCVTIGKPFPVSAVYMIKIGETTRDDVEHLFGPPWRKGIDSGEKTWTYAHYLYTVFGSPMTRDLIVRFDENGMVTTYSFSSSYPEDAR
jgi:hypothetical protein